MKQSDYLTQAKHAGKLFFNWFAGPALLYLVILFIFQPAFLTNFSSAFFIDSGDGYQNVWNIWWVDKALVQDGTNPYFTTMVEWPHGTTLIPQTMSIFNAFMAIPLMHIFNFGLVEALNFAVIFSFVMGGVTMFWFIRKLHKKYWVAIIGGALFTFSTYHFAHATGHLQLVSLEWIPLFLLAFWTLLEKFRWRDAFFASGALFLVLLCDYYYLFWSVMLGGMWLLWKLYKKEVPFTKKNMLVFGLFVALVLLLVGPLIFALWNLTKTDVLLGFHDPVVFSMDPLTIFIPGGSWYWWHLTEFYSSKLPYFSEMSIFFGFGLLSVLAVAGFKRVFKRTQFKMPPWLDFWWIVLIVFGLLALGPHLRIASHVLESVPLPYAFLEMIFPTLQISGMPVRWILVALIAAIVIVTYMLSRLDIRTKKAKYIVAAFIAVSIVDLYPRPIPLTTAQVGEYVHRLKQLPPGAVLDEAAESEPMQLRNQTVHEKPIPFGYVTRLPKSVDEKNSHIWAASQRGEYARLCNEFGIRYISQPTERPMPLLDDSLIIFRDSQAKLYDLQVLSTSSGSLPCSKQ